MWRKINSNARERDRQTDRMGWREKRVSKRGPKKNEMDKKPKHNERTVRKLLHEKVGGQREKTGESTSDDSTSMMEERREEGVVMNPHHSSPIPLSSKSDLIPTPCCSAVNVPSSIRIQSQE